MFKRLKAHILCELYLLFCGMWRGECKLIIQQSDRCPKTIFIGTIIGSFLEDHIIVKTFYNDGAMYLLS